MSSKPVLLVDLDDTLASQKDAVISFLTGEMGFSHTGPTGPEEDHWHPKTWFAEEPEEVIEVFMGYGSHILSVAPVVNGAKEALSALSEEFTIIGCTGRKPEYRELSFMWVEEHLPGLVTDIEFVQVPGGPHLPKTVIADKHNAVSLVDDLPFYLDDFAKDGRHAVYLNHGYPWQIEIESESVETATSWAEAVALLRSRLR